MKPPAIERLIRQRRRLLYSYVVHVVWFIAMIASAASGSSKAVVAGSVILALVTVPPVIACAAAVHKTCRAIDPRTGTIGLAPMIIMTASLTPFESGLVAPARNLLASGKLLKRLHMGVAEPDNHSFRTGLPARPGSGVGPH